ncbi:hypothetical protein [Nonomuraea sp. NPDC050310]|uniref:hypothetical protein n=1 Tax=Nonomuraea sp. NPDC050310 TaxID=3154935 RepID=UPI0034072DD9
MTRLVLAWGAIVVAATAAAVAVLGLFGGLLGTHGHVMSQDEVRAALASASASPRPALSPASPRPSLSPSSPRPAVTGEATALTSPGGTVVAVCEAGQVILRSWSPAQGYSIDEADPGPAPVARVEFDGDDREDVEVRVACSGDRPALVTG